MTTDLHTLYHRAGGSPFFEALVGRFYDGVESDPLLRPVYPEPDLAGARRRLTLFLIQYWGGPTTYDDERMCAQLDQWVTLGCDKVKIKIGESRGSRTERDMDRVALARHTVGDAVSLFVDANGGYAAAQARTVGRILDRLGVAWFEEPVSSDDHDGLAQVRDHVAADVAAGEYGDSLAYLVHLAPFVDCLQVDVTRCGGCGWESS